MLMNIECSPITSIKLSLTYDDNVTREVEIGVGDLVDISFFDRGVKKHLDGKVLKVACPGMDPKGWYLIVDGSDDFCSEQVKFSPMNICDCEIIQKARNVQTVATPIGKEGVNFMKVIDGELYYCQNGYDWVPVKISEKNIIKNTVES